MNPYSSDWRDFLGHEDGGAVGVNPEVLEQGLLEREPGKGGVPGEGRRGFAAGGEGLVERFVEGSAEAVFRAPRSQGHAAVGAADAELVMLVFDVLGGAGEGASVAGGVVVIGVHEAGEEGRLIIGAVGGLEAEFVELRVEALDFEIEIVLQRHLHGVFQRQGLGFIGLADRCGDATSQAADNSEAFHQLDIGRMTVCSTSTYSSIHGGAGGWALL